MERPFSPQNPDGEWDTKDVVGRINFEPFDTMMARPASMRFAQKSTEAEIDALTAERIRKLTGGHDNELAGLRKAVLALLAIIRPSQFTKDEIQSAMDTGDKLLELNRKIEKLVAEGKELKRNLHNGV